MPVLALLLAPEYLDVLDFCRTFVDFILIAQYCSYDNTTLGYLDQALMRINVYKKVFWANQCSNSNIERRFNFPKYHVMLQYSDHICKFSTTDSYDMAHFKINHKTMLKVFYGKTNKHDTFQKQLLWHNKRRIKALAMEDILASFDTRRRMDFTEDIINKDSIKAINTRSTWNSLELSLLGTLDQTDEGRGTKTTSLNS